MSEEAVEEWSSASHAELSAIDFRADSLTERVFEMIRDAIISKSIPPGSTFTEAGLAAQLKVSKTPVRESLIRLRDLGLVESEGRRLRVIIPSVGGLRDAYEYRHSFEPQTARYAARRANGQQIDEIRRLARETVVTAGRGDSAKNGDAGRRFHLSIGSASGNSMLLAAVTRGLLVTQTYMRRDFSETLDRSTRAEHHLEIANAIANGDEEAAAAAMAAHTSYLLESALKSFSQE